MSDAIREGEPHPAPVPDIEGLLIQAAKSQLSALTTTLNKLSRGFNVSVAFSIQTDPSSKAVTMQSLRIVKTLEEGNAQPPQA